MKKRVEIKITDCLSCPFAEFDRQTDEGKNFWRCGKTQLLLVADQLGFVPIKASCPLPSVKEEEDEE